MFLCREKELKKMNVRYQNKGLECIIIYGRRRVGKTALINEFVKNKPTIYFPALDTNARGNLSALSCAIHNYQHPHSQEAPVYNTFDAAFDEITQIAKNSDRVVFVIDEYPYLAKADNAVPSKLQHLLDHDWAETNLYLILCGSSMSFMEDHVLSQKSPLFGRRTAQFKIKPLTYLESARFHPELSPEENALIYGITGGIPHYIRKLDVRTSIKDALLENLFDSSSYLFEEPANLLKQELREPAVYNAVITANANGSARLNEISSKVGIDNAVCSKYLRGLSELEIIRKTEPVVDKTKKKTLYRITDNFFRFWYRFVPNNMMAVNSGRMEEIYDKTVERYLPEYMGPVFEEICTQYLVHYAKNLPFYITEIGEWWGTHPIRKKEAQLDIVALGTEDNERNLLIGSCKYRNEKIGCEELDLIRDYASAIAKARDKCYFKIFSKSGFTDALYEKEKAGDVSLVSIEELYNVRTR